MLPSQSGGGGTVKVASDLALITISSALLIMVATARDKGTMRASSRTRVITATASHLLPHRRAWRATRRGQVATTIMVAQIKALTNGRTTQKLAAMSIPINRTIRAVRVIS